MSTRFRFLKVMLSAFLFIAIAAPAVHASGDRYVTQITFVDMNESHWANSAITDLAKSQIISGYEDGSFKPEKHVTREEFAALIAKTFYLDLPGTDSAQTYYDVSPDRWSFPYIEASKDFLTGYYPPSGKAIFNPTTDATREDVAVALVKTLGYQPDELQDNKILERRFYDLGSISPNLRTYVALAVEKQLFDGYPNGTFRGDKQVTRAEVASLLHRVIKNASTDSRTGIQLDVIVPETTTSNSFYVSGETTKGATVTINGREVEVYQGQFKEGVRIDEGEGVYRIVVVSKIPGGKSKTVTKEIRYEKGAPTLTVKDIPQQTNKQSVTISWSVSGDHDPVVYVNDEAQSSWSSGKTVELQEGANTITVKAVNSLGKTTTVTKQITFNTDGPVLKVSDIPETTDKQTVTVSWSVSDKNDSSPKVYVNDEVQSGYTTSKTISLEEGVNTIVFKATNKLGKSITVTKTISLGTGAPNLKVGPIPSTTESERVNVSWSVTDTNDSSPKVYINDQLQSYTTSASIVLEPGENTLIFKATNARGKEIALTRTITFNPPAPKLILGHIPSTTANKTVSITWTVTDKNDSYPKVYVNDMLQSYTSSTTLQLADGANPIQVLATNKYGKVTTVTETVYRNQK
ncbi:S-layer homology domain-containing protein [Paenibacillus sp. UNCCL117]|uniref:S-layer homology domain-containing protein n=1 Tax=unclassified Paenibacillus TaxID=185978 RepID=UPI00088C4C04|nr:MULTISPECIES: S-layer homology domain-containing protein [unclassified Paenibacillus]SDD65574.1 S-layer homology domain-containing protein [Paenibacillus sp. cl123]SFW58099.1 S-layer homology domain-containing protein [Paenibacillus sp. UNCCL117]